MIRVPLIARSALFGNPSQFQARLSPDGEWLTWLAPFESVLNVWLAPADQIAEATDDGRRRRQALKRRTMDTSHPMLRHG
jgi:hypothetical protein